MMGSLGMTPFESSAKNGIAAWKNFEERVHKIVDHFEHHGSKTLKENWKDWDVVVDDDVVDDPADTEN